MESRLTINELIKFIDSHSDKYSKIGSVDLRKVVSSPKNEDCMDGEITQLKYNDVNYVFGLPKEISKIFDIENNKFLHTGVLNKLSSFDDRNISVFSSIFSCISMTFQNLGKESQCKFIEIFLTRLTKECKCDFFDTEEYKKKYKWKKEKIINNIKLGKFGKDIVKITSNLLHINIFILDISDDTIYFADDMFVKYKQNIFLIHFGNNIFEPIFSCQSRRTFNHDDELMKNIINEYSSNIQMFSFTMEKTEKNEEFICHTENLSKYIRVIKDDIEMDIQDKRLNYLMKKNSKYVIDDTDKSEDEVKETKTNENTFEVEHNVFTENLNSDDEKDEQHENITNLESKKLLELQNIATSLKIPIKKLKNNKNINKTRNELIVEIKEKNKK